MSHEKPDMLRQSEGFERIHATLTVRLIDTPRDGNADRPGVRTCRADDSFAQVRAVNVTPAYDYLPVEDDRGDIVGLFHAKSHVNGTGGREPAFVKDHMCPLSEADLIGGDATIFDFISRVRPKPLLVVSGTRIDGLVAWSDLQKLPVRAAVFALVTGFELTMYEAIRAVFAAGDGWRKYLGETRLKNAKRVYEQRGGNDSDVELLLCTEFCDKRTILEKCLPFDTQAAESGSMPMSKRRFESDVKRIEELRNPLAHASSYAMSWDAVEALRETVRILAELRNHIRRAASKHDSNAHPADADDTGRAGSFVAAKAGEPAYSAHSHRFASYCVL